MSLSLKNSTIRKWIIYYWTNCIGGDKTWAYVHINNSWVNVVKRECCLSADNNRVKSKRVFHLICLSSDCVSELPVSVTDYNIKMLDRMILFKINSIHVKLLLNFNVLDYKSRSIFEILKCISNSNLTVKIYFYRIILNKDWESLNGIDLYKDGKLFNFLTWEHD